jgi:hypothetical protein
MRIALPNREEAIYVRLLLVSGMTLFVVLRDAAEKPEVMLSQQPMGRRFSGTVFSLDELIQL